MWEVYFRSGRGPTFRAENRFESTHEEQDQSDCTARTAFTQPECRRAARRVDRNAQAIGVLH